MDFTQAQFVKLCELHTLLHALGFVGGENTGLAEFAQKIGNVVVLSAQSLTGIDHKNHQIGLGHGLLGLLGHLFVDASSCVGLKPPCVHHNEFKGALFTLAVMAVPGQARKVSHDGVSRLGQSIEKGGFAHIGPPHQGQNRLHGWAGEICQACTKPLRVTVMMRPWAAVGLAAHPLPSLATR